MQRVLVERYGGRHGLRDAGALESALYRPQSGHYEDAVWEARPAESRRSAAASRQSQPIRSREELEAAVAAQPKEPSRPPYWGCYRLVPESYEFWRHRENRLHERRPEAGDLRLRAADDRGDAVEDLGVREGHGREHAGLGVILSGAKEA